MGEAARKERPPPNGGFGGGLRQQYQITCETSGLGQQWKHGFWIQAFKDENLV